MKFTPVSILLVVLALVYAPALTYAAERTQPKLGHTLSPIAKPFPAAGFTLMDIDDNEVSLADFKGQVILLNFWASWCPPCIREMPSMERLYQTLKAQDFVVLAVNQTEEMDVVFAFTGQLSVEPTFPILFDSESRISDQYPVMGLPTTFLIDKQGMVRYRAIGGREFDHPEVIKQIQALINE